MEKLEFDIEDIIGGNHPVEISQDTINTISGKVVVVTGAAGSIGSEICRLLLRKCNPKRLYLIDNAETAMHEMTLELGKQPNVSYTIADIRDRQRIESLFNTFKPDIIFHAAAYKHVPLMEENPYEAANVNILGTKNIADMADKCGASIFVLASTDKAVCPIGIMGASKRIAEMYIQSRTSKCHYLTVRFCNVANSNGSAIPLFMRQIKNGGPVTITDPAMTRYFMTIPEACSLIIEACSLGNGNDTFIFNTGKPIKITDIANKLIKLNGNNDIKIVETGIRRGEKLTEQLLNNNETTIPTQHPSIMKILSKHADKNTVDSIIDSISKTLSTNNDTAIAKIILENAMT